ncbi:MAG TPA: hypothetical protein VM914_00555 [Pyrinomonadaceae bacterium]|nr:hypothetical protein [Pyrinomonadaceae bacterium]
MGVLNTLALIVLGILLLRKLILMDRFFVFRAVLITGFLCGLLLLLTFLFLAGTEMHCANSYAPDVYFCR